MKKYVSILVILVVASSALVFANRKVLFNLIGNVAAGTSADNVTDIRISENGEQITMTTPNGSATFSTADIKDLTFAEAEDVVAIKYNGNAVEVVNPFACDGVTVETNGAHVTVHSTNADEVTYVLSGTSDNGSFKMYNSNKYIIRLNGVNLTNPTGPAINCQGKKKTTIFAVEGTQNTLCDGKTYTPCGEEDMKGTVFSEGKFEFDGTGALTVKALKGHAVVCDDVIEINNGNITVSGAANDAFHSKDEFKLKGGTLNLINNIGDAIDGGSGPVNLRGGTLNVSVNQTGGKGVKCGGILTISDGIVKINTTGASVASGTDVTYCSAVKCDSIMEITGGDITITTTGVGAKGLSADRNINISGGKINITSQSAPLSVSNNVHCAIGIKSNEVLNISGGEMEITMSGAGGKCISNDGNVNITGGKLTLKTTGNGGTYTAGSTTDTYSASCLKSDAQINITGGTVSCTSSGTGGKGINAGTNLVIGTQGGDNTTPIVTAATTGSKIGGSSGGGPGGGRPGPGGSSSSSTSASPKAIKAAVNVTINSGSVTATTTQDGGEGIEAKNIVTINGGDVVCKTYDDGINGGKQVVINGGRIFTQASNNDGIDSNGTFLMTGGIILSNGSTSPEEGFDCDQNTFKITGGILIGTGGATSTPTASQCTQRTVIRSSYAMTSGRVLRVTDNKGQEIVCYRFPRTITGTLFISAPNIGSGVTLTYANGVTATGGTEWNGYISGASCSGGTTSTITTSTSSMVTSSGSSGGGGRW